MNSPKWSARETVMKTVGLLGMSGLNTSKRWIVPVWKTAGIYSVVIGQRARRSGARVLMPPHKSLAINRKECHNHF